MCVRFEGLPEEEEAVGRDLVQQPRRDAAEEAARALDAPDVRRDAQQPQRCRAAGGRAAAAGRERDL